MQKPKPKKVTMVHRAEDYYLGKRDWGVPGNYLFKGSGIFVTGERYESFCLYTWPLLSAAT